MEEKLVNTINKIKALASQNAEFDQEMRKMFGNVSPIKTTYSNNQQRVAHIEKYLGLDYFVDTASSIIDYSFIKEDNVRNQLISDNREMLRIRYGTRYHIIDFSEYCRYSFMQAEMLLNYFYSKGKGTITEIIKHIQKFNPNAYIKKDTSSLSAIEFNAKYYAFKKEFNITTKPYNIWDLIRKVRNSQSHRILETGYNYEKYQTFLEKKRVPIMSDGQVNFYKMKENKDKEALSFYDKIKNTKEYKEYLFALFLKEKNFDSIVEAIKQIKDCVSGGMNVLSVAQSNVPPQQWL